MAIPLFGAAGALFNRLGKHGLVANQGASYQSSQLTNLTNTTTGLVAQYSGESDLQALVGSTYIGVLNSVGGGFSGLLRTLAEGTFNRMVFRDQARLSQTLSQINVLDSVLEVVRQMKVQGASVRQHDSVAATAAAFTRNNSSLQGLGIMTASVVRPRDGLVVQHAFAEEIECLVSTDSNVGGAVAGNETIGFSGKGIENDVWAFNWPLGSGCSGTVQAIDGSVNNGGGNKLINSGFESWVANTPANYTVASGASLIARETSIFYGPSGSSLRITGDGTTLANFRQGFNGLANGTTDTLDPITQYSFNIYARSGGAGATGQVVVDLVDGNLNVVNDEAGTANSLTINLANLTTDWQAFNFFIRTPLIMPSSYSLRFRNPAGQPVNNGGIVYLDKASLGNAVQTVSSGVYLACHSGATPFALDDRALVTTTNGRGASGTLNTFQTLVYRLLYPLMKDQEIILRYSTTPNILDSLLT